VSFDTAAIHEIVTTNRATAIASIAAAVTDRGADGVNLDFEGVAAADRTALVEFVGALREALPTGHISMAVPAVDWSNAWDYAALVELVDRLILMGYDYHWRSSDPGPVAPLSSGDVWSFRNVAWSVDDLLTKTGGRADRILLGVPLYGYDYPSSGPEIPGTATADAESVFYVDAEMEAEVYGRLWDAASQTPYYLYQAGSAWHQVWYDDAESLGLKFDFAVERDLAGAALWALNYQSDTLWGTVEAHLSTGRAVDAGPVDSPPMVDAPDSAAPDEGCACRAGARRRAPRGASVALLLVVVATAARRRRST